MTRLKRFVRHMASRRGILTLTAAMLSIAGLLTPEPLSTALLIVAIGMTAGVLLLLSFRLSQLHALISRPKTAPEQSREHIDSSPAGLATPDSVALPDGPSPQVTIVVPNYNDSSNVMDAIASIQSQTFEDWECIVVDDASTDDSLRSIWLAAKGDKRFRIVRHRVNGGLPATRNTGLRLARGRFVSFLDSDDLLMRRSIEDRIVSLVGAIADPHVVGSYTGVAYRSDGIRPEDLPAAMTWDEREGVVVDFITAQGECPFPAMAPLMRTDALRLVGGFDESMREGAEDWDLWQRLLRNGYVFVPSASKTAVYRQRPNSMIRESPAAHARIGIRLIEESHGDTGQGVITSSAPTPLPRSIDFYSKRIAQSRRAIRFAAMSYQGDGKGAAEALIEPVVDVPLSLLTRHVDVADEVRRGLARSRISTGTLDDQELAREITEWVHSRAARPESEPSVSSHEIDTLLIPQHSSHLADMLAHLDIECPDTHYEVLLLEREGADQGARDAVPPQVTIRTLNEWVLGGYEARSAMIGQVRNWVVEEIAQDLAAQGTSIIELEDGYAEIKSVPEAPQRSATALTREAGPDAGSRPKVETGFSVTEQWHRVEDPDTKVDFDEIGRFKDIHLGDRAVIIGNGPSLNLIDLSLLRDELTFGVNGIFYASDRMGFDPTFYVVEDSAVVEDNLEAIREYRAGHKFFPSIYREKIGDLPNVSYFMMNRSFYAPDSLDFCVPNFAADCVNQIFCGQSVTIINLQLAFHMGFAEVILIGMDFSYTIPDDAEQSGYQIRSAGPDPNHFHPDYFGKGKVWKQPKLNRVLASYALAKQVYETAGRRIVNATPGGELHLFDRISYDSLFR